MADASMNMTDYEATRASFRLEVPEHFNFTTDVVEHWEAREPDRLALLAVGPEGQETARWTFGDVAVQARKAANLLAAHGVGRGDRLLVVLPRIPEWYPVLLGAFRLGAVPMPGTTQLSANDMAYRIQESEASVAVVDEAGVAKIEQIRSQCPSLRTLIVVGAGAPDGWLQWEDGLAEASSQAPDVPTTAATDPLLIYFTSGTTGPPKMVLHTHASYGIGHEVTARFWQDLEPGDLHWTVSDLGWAKAAWGKLFGQWRLGATVLLWNAQGKPDFELMLRMMEHYRVTTFCAPPTIYRQFVTMDLSAYDFTHLRHAMAAGEALNPETSEAWRQATGTEIHDGYGQTETCNLLANFRCLPKRPGSMGKPVPGFDVQIVDDHGQPVEPGTVGDIAVRVAPERPVGLFQEYWRNPGGTKAAFRGDWYFTGDRGSMDEDGYFYFSARADDVIISSGYRIGPFEVESAIMEHPAVLETAVIGVPDPTRGEVVKAFVVLAPGHEAGPELSAEIQDLVKSQTAPYKYPRQVEFIEELPKTISGKIRRVELRQG